MIRFARSLLFVLAAALVASCDSGSSQVTLPGKSSYKLTLSLVQPKAGAPATETSVAAPLRIDLELRDPSNALVTGGTIKLAATGIGVLANTSVQTSTGAASVVLGPGTSATAGIYAGTITASFTDPDLNVVSTTPVNYTSKGDDVTTSGSTGGTTATNVLKVVLSAKDGAGQVISSTRPITSTNPGRLIATVTLDGQPKQNALLTFKVPGIASLEPAVGTVATDVNGNGEIIVNALQSGAGNASVTADFNGQTVSASLVISTSIVASTPSVLDIGLLTGTTFAAGGLVASSSSIAAGSTITVTGNVYDTTNSVPWGSPISVSFESACAATGLATIDQLATTTGTNAQVQATYHATGCVGNDTIKATLKDGSRIRTATVNVAVAAAPVGDMIFVSAVPQTMSLLGFGGVNPTGSNVTFLVHGVDGSAVRSKLVCFGLSTVVGGIGLTNTQGLTSDTGQVTARVLAGSIPTSVRVQAVVDNDGDNNCTTIDSTHPTTNPVISAVSNNLTISTGLPDQKSFTLAANVADGINPDADIIGQKVQFIVRAADHFNNPVPNGTAVTFWTELGAIKPTCDGNNGTVDGVCTTTWTSQAPFDNQLPQTSPATAARQVDSPYGWYGPGTRKINDRKGRSTVIAYAVGEEAFADSNGNGRFDPGEQAASDDLGEIIKDSNENGQLDKFTPALSGFANEEFVDFDRNGVRDAGNGIYDGVLCNPATTTTANCSGNATVNVRQSMVLVMSTRSFRLYLLKVGKFDPSDVDFAGDGSMFDKSTGESLDGSNVPTGTEPTTPIINYINNQALTSRNFEFVLTDANGNAPPINTKIEVSATDTSAFVQLESKTFTVPSQSEYYQGFVTFTQPAVFPISTGFIFFKITVGLGDSKTVITTAPIIVDLFCDDPLTTAVESPYMTCARAATNPYGYYNGTQLH